MKRNCTCGGRLVPCGTSSLAARFVCNKCGDTREQRKRQPRPRTHAPLIERVSDDIIKAMIKRGISQHELAKRLNVSEARVSKMLDKANMRLSTVESIFTALGLHVPLK